jgi:copper type II ascorbate-dependent monooxygenase-like protein
MIRPSLWTLLALSVLGGCPESNPPAAPGPDVDTGIGVPGPDEGIQLRMATTVAAGQEITYCQYFHLPDHTVEVNRFEHEYTQGSHHLLLIRVDPTAPPPEGMFPCGSSEAVNIDDRPIGILYGAQTPEGEADLPDGVAMELEAGSTVLMQSHYLNTTTEDLDASVTVNLWFTDPSTVQEQASTLFFFNPFIYVPAGEEASTTMRCPLPAGTHLLSAASHMHRHGTGFEAQVLDDGQASALYHTDQWADPDPASFFDHPLEVGADSQLEFTCHYQNDDDVDVAVGFSAQTDEMCIFAGLYYPAGDRAMETCENGQLVGQGQATCGQTLLCAQQCGNDTACAAGCTTQVCEASSPALTSAIMCLVDECAGGGLGCAVQNCGSELLSCTNAGC